MHAKIRTKLSSLVKSRLIERLPYNFTYQNNEKKSWIGEIETTFTTEDGREIPVFKNHRYSLKKCWSVYGPTAALRELILKDLASEETKTFFKECIGYRTITKPFDEIREHVKPYIEKHRDLFISQNIPDIGKRLMIPSSDETMAIVNRKAQEHKNLIETINKNVAKKIHDNDKVLEIGYTSGGESIIAFEKCGLQSIGIDNYYGDAVDATNRHECVKRNAPSKTTFLKGDITQETEIESNSIDMIYSLSVIEHIMDLEGAFKEMFRILKPGAVMFHKYDPYFHILGGHSHSTLDCPWGHVRLSGNDIEKYINELRPHEAAITLPWIKNALNRDHSQTNILKLLTKTGFKIALWQNSTMKPDHQTLLTPDIIGECINNNAEASLSISDLCSGGVSIIAEKPA